MLKVLVERVVLSMQGVLTLLLLLLLLIGQLVQTGGCFENVLKVLIA